MDKQGKHSAFLNSNIIAGSTYAETSKSIFLQYHSNQGLLLGWTFFKKKKVKITTPPNWLSDYVTCKFSFTFKIVSHNIKPNRQQESVHKTGKASQELYKPPSLKWKYIRIAMT